MFREYRGNSIIVSQARYKEQIRKVQEKGTRYKELLREARRLDQLPIQYAPTVDAAVHNAFNNPESAAAIAHLMEVDKEYQKRSKASDNAHAQARKALRDWHNASRLLRRMVVRTK